MCVCMYVCLDFLYGARNTDSVTRAGAHMYICVCRYVCMYICMYVCRYIYMYIYIYLYVCVYVCLSCVPLRGSEYGEGRSRVGRLARIPNRLRSHFGSRCQVTSSAAGIDGGLELAAAWSSHYDVGPATGCGGLLRLRKCGGLQRLRRLRRARRFSRD